MGLLETPLIVLLSSSLCLFLLSLLLKLLHEIWLNPIMIQRAMSSQGIRGPPYRFIHGNTKEILKMTTESTSRPVMNFSHDMFPRIQPHLHSWLNTYGRNFLTWFGPEARLVITEPELVKEVFNNREGAYPKAEFEGFAKKLLGNGLGESNGEKWARQRKLANHAFGAESLKNMLPAMTESVLKMLEGWKIYEGKEIEVFEEFRVLTSDVISRTAFGSSYLDGKSIFERLHELGTIISRNTFKIRLPLLSRFWKNTDETMSEKLEKGMRDSIIGIMKNRENSAIEIDNYGNDLLGLLVMAKNDPDENNRITVDDVVDECKTFYFAGHETTSTLLAWTVFLLAIHTDWQDKAREEVLKLFGQENPSTEGIARMKMMNMIIHESLRLYPPILSNARKVQKKVNLDKLVLPTNIMLDISTLALHSDPQIWGEDVHLFKPERFSEGVAKATNNQPAVYVPFGFGPRICVGMNFAMNEAKITLSMILQRHVLTLSPSYTHSPVKILTLRPQHGIQIMLHPL